MNNLKIYLVVALILGTISVMVSVSCGRSRFDSRLERVEQLMDEHPDSALAIVRAIDTSSLTKDNDKALWGLLRSQALYKCYEPIPDDSTLFYSVEYFAKEGDERREMLSHYYMGQLHYQKMEYPQAIVSFYKARKIAKGSQDHFWHGMSAQGISDVYCMTFNNKEDLAMAQEAYEAFKQYGRQPYINYALLEVARAYVNNDSTGIFSISQCLKDSANKYENSDILRNVMNYEGGFWIRRNRYDKALPIFLDILDQGIANDKDSAYFILAMAHINPKRALSLMDSNSNIQHPIINDAMEYLGEKISNSSLTLKGLRNNISHSDSLIKNQIRANLTGFVVNYMESEEVKAKAEKKDLGYKVIIASVIIALVLVCMGWAIWANKIAKDKDLDNKIGLIEDLNAELRQSKDLEAQINERLLSQKDKLDEVEKTLSCNRQKLQETENLLLSEQRNLAEKEKEVVTYRQKLDESENRLDEISQKYKENREIVNSDYAQIRKQLINHQISLLNEVCEIHFAYINAKDNDVKRDKQSIRKVNECVARYKFDGNNVKKLENLADKAYHNVYSDFKADFTDLKDSDKLCFLYAVLGFSIKATAFLLNENSMNSIYERRRRLRDKIKSKDVDSSERYLLFL